MICPYCHSKIPDSSNDCPICRRRIEDSYIEHHTNRRLQPNAAQAFLEKHQTAVDILKGVLTVLVVMFALIWLSHIIRDWQFSRQYTRGDLTPQVYEITMDNDVAGHALIFYGEDGDQILLKELSASYTIADGMCRIELEDGMWFNDDIVEEADTLTVTIHPVLITKGLQERKLPSMSLTVSAPSSPLTITAPASGMETVYTTLMPLTFHVVPGSTVLINGTDASDQVDRNGDITYNVNVYAIGDNTYSILVKTPNHKETRQDVVYYRAKLEIDVSLDSSVATKSSNSTFRVTGVTEPDSEIRVDSEYIADSITVNHETGAFSFIAVLNTIGKNTIRFHAEKEGCANAAISFSVNYVPTLAEYSKKAWKMDYTQLKQLYEQWTGRVFLCTGTVTEIFTEGDVQYIVMDVSTVEGTQQLVMLENQSSLGKPVRGTKYNAYADVSGRKYHNEVYLPLLICRYMSEKD